MDLKGTLFKELFLKFKEELPEIRDFYENKDQQSKQVLHVITPKSEEPFISMRVLSILSSAPRDSFVMLSSSLASEVMKQGLNVFKSREACKLLILQIDPEKPLSGDDKKKLEEALQDQTKRVILVSDQKWKNKIQNSETIQTAKTFLTDLTKESLKKVLELPVKLQNSSVAWKDLLDEKHFAETSLADLINTKSVAGDVPVSKDNLMGLYVPRTFTYKNVLKPEVLKECSGNFVYSEKDFVAKLQAEPAKNLHWLEKDGETLKWKKTSRDISGILKYINEGESQQPKEDSMTSMTQRISILIDIAGMGKSTFLNQLAQKLKEKHGIHWVVKVDLNDFTSEFDEVKSDQLKIPEEAIEFLGNKILKLSSAFEKDLFRQSCMETGNVILLFDGYDEVASYYKDEVTQLIKSLLQTSVGKVFIASRPEWAEFLETTFLQIKYSLMPFEKENQEKYLLSFIVQKIGNVDEDLLKKIVEMILVSMSKSLRDEDYKFTGVPLITKLVAEFFESKISEHFQGTNQSFDDLTEKLGRETFNLVQLYDHFVEKKLEIYFKEKCKMDLSNARQKKENIKKQKVIRENYETLAVQQILKTDLEKHLPKFREKKFDEDELEDLVKIGLIYQIGKDFKFSHQTYGEFGFNKFLRNNFDDEDCAKFISEVVLVDESYRIIRSFVNYWIIEKIDGKTCAMYQKKLLESPVKDRKERTPLHVAGKEGNQNVFWFLYSSLAAKTENFENKKSIIQSYFLKLPKKEYTAIVYYFWNCDDSFDLLKAIQRDFGSGFVKSLFTFKMRFEKNLLHEICQSNSGIFSKIFTVLREYFSNDPDFLKPLFLSRDRFGQSFLHFAFWFLKNEKLLELLEELEKMKSDPEFGQDFVKELVLMGSGDFGVFLSLYAQSKHFRNDFFLEYLKQLKFLCDEETLRKFFLVVGFGSNTFLHEFCERAKNFDLLQTLKWVADELGQKFLLKLISMEDDWGRTIFHQFISSPRQSNPAQKFLKVLEFLHQDLGLENKVLLDILSIEDWRKDNCLNLICDEKDQKITEILDFLSKVFQNDRDWLKKLFNKKLRGNEEVKEWMGKNNFNLDLFEESDEESD
jgi:hypothetical protein